MFSFNITRDKIPIYSVDAGYMVNDKIGYIKVSRFAATTYDEFLDKLEMLKENGMQSLILDLRGNPGGYLNAAIEICDEFLKEGQLIVYTEGRSRQKTVHMQQAKAVLRKEIWWYWLTKVQHLHRKLFRVRYRITTVEQL